MSMAQVASITGMTVRARGFLGGTVVVAVRGRRRVRVRASFRRMRLSRKTDITAPSYFYPELCGFRVVSKMV